MVQFIKYLNLSVTKNTKNLMWFASAFFFLAIFIKLTAEVFEDNNVLRIDQLILEFIGNHFRIPFLNGIAVDITSLGSPTLIFLFTFIGISTLLITRDFKGSLYLFLSVIGGTFWMLLLKNYMGRPRPQIISHLVEVQGLSYPSGHSLVATVTYLSLAILICRHLKSIKMISLVFSVAFIIIFLIAFSRLYLGVHYPSDVISGILFGFAWILLLTALFKNFPAINQDNNFNSFK